MKYEWLLLDIDGTLFDYDGAESLALARTFGQMGLPFKPGHVATYRGINHQLWQDFELGKRSQNRLKVERFELLFDAIGVECNAELFSQRYLRNLATGSELFPGAREVVETLHGRMGLLLITNGLSEVQRPRLQGSAIGHYFGDMVISEEVGSSKPDRGIFDVAFEKMDHPRKEAVLIVGDSLTSDILGANNYGIDACWYNPGEKPDTLGLRIQYEIERLDELLPIVGLAPWSENT